MSESIRYVAMGDSFTEGVGDPDASRPNGVRGWADRVAEQFMLADEHALYANLAIRGRLLGPIIDEQLQAAVGLKPNLVSLYGGGNDILRPNVDIDALVERQGEAFKVLRAEGIEVFTFTGMDVRDFAVFKPARARTAVYNELLREIADENGVHIVDLWRMRDFADQRYFAPDRLHMNTRGHIKMALRVLEAVEAKPVDIAPQQLPLRVSGTRCEYMWQQVRWMHQHVLPWVGRRLRGTSSGDGLSAKYPELMRFEAECCDRLG